MTKTQTVDFAVLLFPTLKADVGVKIMHMPLTSTLFIVHCTHDTDILPGGRGIILNSP
jgi:hypothetical protein